MHIPPRLGWRNGEVHYERLRLVWASISNLNPDRLTLGAEARMDDDVATHQMGYTERAPDARRPQLSWSLSTQFSVGVRVKG